MALVLADRVQETTTTTGTGTVTLNGAVSGFQSFSAVGNGNTTYYTIADQTGTNWEVGLGTYTASGTTLSRDSVLSSSNSGSLVNFGAGTKNVFVTYPASKAVYNGGALGTPLSGTVTNLTGTASININGTVGATTANTGAFTTLSATGNVTLGDATTDTITLTGTVQPGVVISGSSSGDALRITQTGAGNALLVEDAANPDSTPFVVTAAGDVGIGTSSPAYKLDVTGSANITSFLRVGATPATGGDIRLPNTGIIAGRNAANSSNRVMLQLDSSDRVLLQESSVVIDSSGNLGLGVTPSAWSANGRGFQLFNSGSRASALGSWFGAVGLMNDCFYGSANDFRYYSGGAAALYQQNAGSHSWYTATSGTANTAITFTQAMTLDASGNLGVGITSFSYPLSLYRGAGLACYAEFVGNAQTTASLLIGQDAAGLSRIFQNGANPISFWTNATERARITGGGEVYIAGTTDQGAYNLQVNGTGVWGAGAYVNGSDERLKDNIQTLNDGLAVVSQLRPVTFQYKPEHSKDQSVQPGFIAQELQQAMDGKAYLDGVVQSGPEYLNVAYQNLIPILTKAIQEQQALITSLTARVAALEGTQP